MSESASSYLQRLAQRGIGLPAAARLMPPGLPPFPPPLVLGGEGRGMAGEARTEPMFRRRPAEPREPIAPVDMAARRWGAVEAGADSPPHLSGLADVDTRSVAATTQADRQAAPSPSPVVDPRPSPMRRVDPARAEMTGPSPTQNAPMTQPHGSVDPPQAVRRREVMAEPMPQRAAEIIASRPKTTQPGPPDALIAQHAQPDPALGQARPVTQDSRRESIVTVEPAPAMSPPPVRVRRDAATIAQDDSSSPITVHIGTIEVRGTPPPPAPPSMPPRARAKGFGDYGGMRNYSSWERDR